MDVNSKLTAFADEIRELSGTTTSKSIDAMTSDVQVANTEISEQMALIAQISTALENKAAGSGGVTLPELDNPASASDILKGKEAINGDGEVITGTIETKTSSNLTANGATVTVSAGYYASQATKSVATATQATPSVSIDANGKITASATQTAGYVSAGTRSGTKQLTTQAAKTITPSISSQTAVASGVYTTGVVTVAAIPSNYEDVASETTEYTSLNAALEEVINSLPESSGSSGSLDTCTLRILNSDGRFNVTHVAYEALLEGKRKMKRLLNDSGIYSIDCTVTDALCDGVVVIWGWGDLDQGREITNVVEEAEWPLTGDVPIFRINAPANGTAIIDLLGDD